MSAAHSKVLSSMGFGDEDIALAVDLVGYQDLDKVFQRPPGDS